MLDLKVDRLRLNVENGAGQEHRIRPIATRAVSLLAEHLDKRWAGREQSFDPRDVEGLSIPSISFKLNEMSDEQAANCIARAMLETLVLKLGV